MGRLGWSVALVGSILGAPACASILGIEDLSAGGDSGASDDAGDEAAPNGGTGGSGGAAGAGSSGKPGSGGSSSAMGGRANGSTGGRASGDSGSAGSDAGSSVDEDGGETAPDATTEDVAPPSPTVRGKVIDYNQNAVPDAVVKIGETSVTTDDDGLFVIDDAPPGTYDVSVSISVARYGGTQLSGWLYVGLTRRDPTLQVYRGLPLRSGQYTLHADNVMFPLAEGEEVEMGFGGTYGTFVQGISSAQISTADSWEGPRAVQGSAHALRWTNATTAPRLPTSYLAHDIHTFGLDEAASSQITFDLGSSENLPTGIVSGEVSATNLGDRRNGVFLRFNDTASIQLVDQYSAPDTFSYLVPTIQNSSIVVAAIGSQPGYAVAYVDNVTPGTSDIALDLPSIPTPLAPASNTSNVTADTVFSWEGPDQVYMLHAENADFYESFYVVVAGKEARLPAVPVTNLPLAAGQDYWWHVMTHGEYASVDAATGPKGFLDAYCYGDIRGPRRGSGTHAESVSRGFTSAP